MIIFFALFLAGALTILLPCILPLVPIVLGVSVAGTSRLRPLCIVLGMIVGFVGSTFLLLVLLNQFVELADYIRLATYAVLFLFGLGFVFVAPLPLRIFSFFGGLFFTSKGLAIVVITSLLSVFLVECGSRLASWIQGIGFKAQSIARNEFGTDSLLSSFIIGLTLGLVWVPCAGPALGFAFTLVRNEPGLRAFFGLLSYALGTAIPLLLIGYGGQATVQSFRSFNRYTDVIKKVSGSILVLTSFALLFHWYEFVQVWLLEHTSFGGIGTQLEEKYLRSQFQASSSMSRSTSSASSPLILDQSFSSSASSMNFPALPVLGRAPEFIDLGPWHNGQPVTLASLRGKVVLVDFWTYSCINCIRTLPFIEGYWDQYKDTNSFVVLGVHSPEFIFEKNEHNVARAIIQHSLTYPIAQDNNFGTWKAFSNKYWPAKYLLDAKGYIRYEHFGEGAYTETDAAIQSLLREAGVDSSSFEQSKDTLQPTSAISGSISRETYLGSRSWPVLGNSVGDPSSDAIQYILPSQFKLHTYYLDGLWQLRDNERQVLQSTTGELVMKFLGGEANLVLGTEDGAMPTTVEVSIDGKIARTFQVDHHDLYPLFKGEYGEHELQLRFTGKGVEAFAFTFGR